MVWYYQKTFHLPEGKIPDLLFYCVQTMYLINNTHWSFGFDLRFFHYVLRIVLRWLI